MKSKATEKIPFIQFVKDHEKHWVYPNIYYYESFAGDRDPEEYRPGEEPYVIQKIYGDVAIVDRTDDLEAVWYDTSSVRRPIILMRGTPVTGSQALDIISHTDRVFHMAYRDINSMELERLYHCEYIAGLDFENNWFLSNMYPVNNGWCHPDGTIGFTGLASKYPQLEDILMEFGRYISYFPYLNFVAVYTSWNEIPYSLWDRDYSEMTTDVMRDAIDEGLSENIKLGFWVHDKIIEILTPKDAYAELKKMEAQMDEETIERVHYPERECFVQKAPSCPPDYLKQCIGKYSEALQPQLLNSLQGELLYGNVEL